MSFTSGRLAKLFPGMKVDDRLLRFVCAFYALNINRIGKSQSGVEEDIAHEIERRELPISGFFDAWRTQVIDERLFEFIENDARMVSYFFEFSIRRLNFEVHRPSVLCRKQLQIGRYFDKDSLITFFDLSNTSFSEKQNILDQSRLSFNDWTQETKYLSLFDEGEDVLEAASYYCRRHLRYGDYFENPNDVKIYFDNSEMRPMELKQHVDKIRALFNNRKREKTSRLSSAHFKVSDKAKKEIIELAEMMRMSQSALVDLVFSKSSALELRRRLEKFDKALHSD